jgi:uncharacterized protein
MYLIRLLLIGAAIWIVITAVRRLLRRPQSKTGRIQDAGQMVQCAHCGVYIPKSESLRAGERYYCSADHRARDA